MLLMDARPLVAVLLVRQSKGSSVRSHELLVCGIVLELAEPAMLVLFEKYDIHHAKLHRAFRVVFHPFYRVLSYSEQEVKCNDD